MIVYVIARVKTEARSVERISLNLFPFISSHSDILSRLDRYRVNRNVPALSKMATIIMKKKRRFEYALGDHTSFSCL